MCCFTSCEVGQREPEGQPGPGPGRPGRQSPERWAQGCALQSRGWQPASQPRSQAWRACQKEVTSARPFQPEPGDARAAAEVGTWGRAVWGLRTWDRRWDRTGACSLLVKPGMYLLNQEAVEGISKGEATKAAFPGILPENSRRCGSLVGRLVAEPGLVALVPFLVKTAV